VKKTIILPLAALTLLAATACQPKDGEADSNGTADAAKKTQATMSGPPSPTPTPKETPTESSFTLPSLKGDTQDSAVDLLRGHHLRLGLITNRPAHKEITLPSGGNFGSWVICFTKPAQGSWITNSTEIYLYLAKTASACAKPTPKKTYTPPAPATKKPDASGSHTCFNDGSQTGYACTSTGKVVVEGEYCAKADHGRTLKASNGRMATCEDYNGWRWNA
jgi:hypothetical protein